MATFPRITDLDVRRHDADAGHVAAGDRIVKSVVVEAAPAMPAKLANLPDENDEERRLASYQAALPPPAAASFYCLSDALLAGSGFVFRDGRLLDAPDLIPGYVRHAIDTGTRWDLDLARPTRRVDDPVVIVTGDAHLVYGHWLIDILPRLWFFRSRFGRDGAAYRVLLPSDTPAFARAILTGFFGETRFEFHDVRENLHLRRAVLPSLLHVDHNFHPLNNDFVDDVLRALPPHLGSGGNGPATRLYVTRRGFRAASTSYKREMRNEEEVWDLLRGHGFTLVQPEDLSWAEQVAVFSRAEVVIGESGSALHNVMFSPAGARVICLNPVNQVQVTLAGLRAQQLTLLCFPTHQEGGQQAFTVDLRRLRTAIERAL